MEKAAQERAEASGTPPKPAKLSQTIQCENTAAKSSAQHGTTAELLFAAPVLQALEHAFRSARLPPHLLGGPAFVREQVSKPQLAEWSTPCSAPSGQRPQLPSKERDGRREQNYVLSTALFGSDIAWKSTKDASIPAVAHLVPSPFDSVRSGRSYPSRGR